MFSPKYEFRVIGDGCAGWVIAQSRRWHQWQGGAYLFAHPAFSSFLCPWWSFNLELIVSILPMLALCKVKIFGRIMQTYKPWMYLQLPLRQWGSDNVYLLALSRWKIDIAKNPMPFGHERHNFWKTSTMGGQSTSFKDNPFYICLILVYTAKLRL